MAGPQTRSYSLINTQIQLGVAGRSSQTNRFSGFQGLSHEYGPLDCKETPLAPVSLRMACHMLKQT